VRALIVGEAWGGAAAFAPGTRSGACLARVLGVAAVADVADAINLLRRRPPRAGRKGDAFPRARARARARAAALALAGRPLVVLVGHRVAAAFGAAGRPYLRIFKLRGARAMVAPHPSGVNRWWNDPRNRRRAARRLRAALRGRR